MRPVIVVFGSGTRPNGDPSPSLSARLRRALDEARRSRTTPIIVSGGPVTGPAEGPVMRRWLIAHGIHPQRIIVEPAALYTLDNVQRVAPLIAGLRATRVELVTSAFHMKRSQRLLAVELRAVTGRRVAIIPKAASDAHGKAKHKDEVVKLTRDLATQAERLRSRQPPNMLRAQA